MHVSLILDSRTDISPFKSQRFVSGGMQRKTKGSLQTIYRLVLFLSSLCSPSMPKQPLCQVKQNWLHLGQTNVSPSLKLANTQGAISFVMQKK